MPAILIWFVESSFGQWLLKWAVQHIAEHLKQAIAEHEKQKAIDDAARASVQPMKNATTAGEIDNATDSDLGGL